MLLDKIKNIAEVAFKNFLNVVDYYHMLIILTHFLDGTHDIEYISDTFQDVQSKKKWRYEYFFVDLWYIKSTNF